MQRYTRLWWASILLSSIVTGGGSFLLLKLFTEWPTELVLKTSVVLVVLGDLTLALMMEAVSPTRIKVGPGDRLHDDDLPTDRALVLGDFVDGQGRVSVRGESWLARQAGETATPLTAGAIVHVVEREGLTLVVTEKAR